MGDSPHNELFITTASMTDLGLLSKLSPPTILRKGGKFAPISLGSVGNLPLLTGYGWWQFDDNTLGDADRN